MAGPEAMLRSTRRPPGGRCLAVLVLLTAVAGCAGAPGEIRYASGRQAGVSPDGLHRIETWGGRGQRVYVKPGADLHGYNQILLEPVVMRFSLRSAHSLQPKTVEIVKKSFHEIFEKELRKSAVYTLASAPGPRVLRATPQLIDVVVAAAPAPRTPDEQIIVQSSGAVTLALELADSRSNATLVRVFDRRAVGDQAGLAYRQLPGADVDKARLVFGQWAGRLRRWLDNVRGIPPLPADAPFDEG